jgi:hypothetical protein
MRRDGGRSFRGSCRARLALSRALHPWRWLMIEVARLPASPVHLSVVGLSDVPVLPFVVTDGSFTVLVSGRMPESFDPVTPPLILASPSASSPSRAGHFAPCGTRDLPLLKLRPGDRPSPDGPVNVYSQSPRTPSVDGCHTTDLAPTSWFLTTSPVSSVHGSPHVAAGTGSGFARFSSGSFVEAEASRDGSGVLTGAHPFEGLLLVDSRTASLRPAPLLPFVAMSTSRPPSLRSDHHLAVMLGFERFVPRATGSDVSVVSADPPELLMLRRAVCLFAVGCPSTPSGVRPGTGRLTGHTVLARSGRVVSRRSSRTSDRVLSAPLDAAVHDVRLASPITRVVDRPRALLSLGPVRWWVFAPTTHFRVRCRSRRPLVLRHMALCPCSGRLQGLSPPTSPYPSSPLPAMRDLFLPWVCLPSEACAATAVGAHGLPWVRSRLRFVWAALSLAGAHDGRPMASVRWWKRPPFRATCLLGVLDVKEQLVTNLDSQRRP